MTLSTANTICDPSKSTIMPSKLLYNDDQDCLFTMPMSFSLWQMYLNGTYIPDVIWSGTSSLASTQFNAFKIGIHNTGIVADAFLRGAVDEILFWPTMKDQSFVTIMYQAYNGKPSCTRHITVNHHVPGI